MMYESMDPNSEKIFYKQKSASRCRCFILFGSAIAAFIIGILIGRYVACPDPKTEERREKYLRDEDTTIIEELMNSIDSENIRNNLKILTEKPHLAGDNNTDLGRMLQTRWLQDGLDHVTMTPYHVLLSYPNMSDLNYVELLDGNTTVYKSNLTEPILTPEEDKPGVVPPFNAYSAPGDIHGDLVYVNYARLEDFELLKSMNISVEGKIVFARYGKNYRGDKVHMAEQRKAIGVILFSDPADITNGDTSDVYPHDWWLPPSGAQRGTLLIGDGDPLSADYPAISSAYRAKVDQLYWLPSIPCHPIGYGIAVKLMEQLNGTVVPPEWRGKMNVTYRFGDGFVKPGWRAHIYVTTRNKNATIYNTVGIIRGEFEPDRYVILGNHRDAWVFGALDPSSGTAIMMEIVRVLGAMVKSGKWRPRRSIMFCSWGAEEYGLIGSTEWVEHYVKTLGFRAVAYLNVDIAVEGNFSFWAEGTPMLVNAVTMATKKVPNPNSTEVAAGRKSVYDTWFNTFPDDAKSKPQINLPGSSSDYGAFRDRLGVPILDFAFTSDPKLNLSSYPMYHSVYETFYLVDKIMDRGFQYHRAIGQVWIEMARHLADSLIIPFNVSDYADTLNAMTTTFLKRFKTLLDEQNINTTLLQISMGNFTAAVKDFEKNLEKANLQDPFVVHRINDQLMQLDRSFLDPAGLPNRRLKRHILFAESVIDSYSGSSFPGLSDALVEIQQGHNVTEQWEIVRQHYSVILFAIQSAASTLKNVTDFMVDYY
ncbi:N-acetylated-alpha-linked acidic dipeptidase 2-like isoform X2 [Dreissena polymorpha]|nr:N-acetylated-alpha-linked acidic dipeptidase 2-like isoform X2 [Dreissena polymorpha]